MRTPSAAPVGSSRRVRLLVAALATTLLVLSSAPVSSSTPAPSDAPVSSDASQAPDAAAGGEPTTADVDTFTQNEAEQPCSTSANELWLRRMYDVVLHRTPDDGGIDFWLGRLAAGGDVARNKVVTQFLFSTEGAQGEVDRAYVQLLGRSAEAGGRAFWTTYLTTHPVTVLRANILSSDEILARSGSIEAWLDLLYRELLGRPADPGGRAFWIEQARTGLNRYAIVAFFYYSPENLGRRADTIYAETLGRAPTPDERTAAASIILTRDERNLRALTLASDQYFQQFLFTAAATR